MKAESVHIREGGDHDAAREVITVSFKDLGDGISPYPFALAYAQDDHERFLIGKLEREILASISSGDPSS